MIIGYCRVSTNDQNLDLQIDSLKKVGCEKIYRDKLTGAKADRPGLKLLLNEVRKDDCIIVWRLDRLGRSLKDLVDIVNKLQDKGISFKSLNENIDTTSASGKLIFHIFCSLAEFERALIKERITAGIAAARARGKKLGRKKGISKKAEKISILAAAFYSKNNWPVSEICEQLNISKPTLYKYLKMQNVTLRANDTNFDVMEVTDNSKL